MVRLSGTKVPKHEFKKTHLREVELPTVCKHVVASFSVPDVSTQPALAQETGCLELLSNVSQTMWLFFPSPLQLIGDKILAVSWWYYPPSKWCLQKCYLFSCCLANGKEGVVLGERNLSSDTQPLLWKLQLAEVWAVRCDSTLIQDHMALVSAQIVLCEMLCLELCAPLV